ncbi:MAG TPA: DUF5362 family protein [Pelobium sp.]|nr:DUF5362 family protein [Pelobium sp.]
MEEENKAPQETENHNSLKFESKTKDLLAEIAKWGRFVGIVGFVMCGILLIVALAIVFMSKEIAAQLAAVGQPTTAINNMTGIVYAIIAVLYYFPAKYIYDFSVYMKQAVEHNDQESIDYSFDRLRAFFKFIGMVAIVAIGFYGITFLMALLSGVAG